MDNHAKFSTAFWGTDFCSSAGFDVLVQKCKEGRSMCKDVERFLRSRAKVEDDYHKGLTSILRGKLGETETGTLKNAWDSVCQETAEIATIHLECSRAINLAADRIKAFRAELKSKQEKKEESVKRSFAQKTNLFRRTNEAKRSYELKCDEEYKLGQEIDQAKKYNEITATKDWEKTLNKHQKLVNDSKSKEGQYKENVCAVENSRKNWETEMSEYCDMCQQLEYERHNFLRNEMWAHSNILSQTCVDVDRICENMRKSLEKCNASFDLSTFVHEKGTGSQRPASIHMETYKQGSVVTSRSATGTLKDMFTSKLK